MTEQELKAIDFTTPEGKQELRRVAGVILCQRNYLSFMCYVSSLGREDRELGYGEIKRPLKDLMASYEIYYKKPIDPIHLTWQEAMKWRDWAVEKYGVNTLRDALADVVCTLTKLEPVGREKQRQYACTYLAIHAQPAHYILAAVLCEIRSKGDN